MMKKNVLFLYSNHPMPLAINMMQHLMREGVYTVCLLYYDRINFPLKFPLSSRLNQIQTSAVTWPTGKGLVTKVFHRSIVFALLVTQIWRFKPNVIHAWDFDMLLTAILATIGLRHTKIIFNLQNTKDWMLNPAILKLQRLANRRTDLIIVPSQGFESEYLRKFKLIDAHKKVLWVPNVPTSRQFEHFHSRMPEKSLTVGYVGTIRGLEGIETLVRAAKLARDRSADIRVLFAGTGIERHVVERLAKVYDFVDYLGPYRHDEHILDIYRQVDIFYALYDRSYDKKIHFAIRLGDAINCKLPIVVARGTHMASIVEKLDIGVSVELGDVEALAQILEELAHSPEIRSHYSHNCEKVRPEFVFEYYQDRISTAYSSLWTSNS